MVVIDRSGSIVLRYSKVHVCQHTVERHCVSGASFSVSMIGTAAGDVRLGAMICYDREFPESARILGLKGAEIVLIPNACIFDNHRVAQLKTRAFENKLVIAMTNYPSTHPDCDGRSLGVSAIALGDVQPSHITPTNRQAPYRETVLVEASHDPGVFEFAIDLDEVRHYRRNAIWGPPHRQVHAYSDLVAAGIGTDFAPTRIIS
jgi:predicted amidohydrolase